MTIDGRPLLPGRGEGEVLVLRAPLSFWGGVDPATGCIGLTDHPDYGCSLVGKVVAIPALVGSSSSSAVMLELLYADRAPAALVLPEADAILCLGIIVAAEMGWRTIPVVAADPSMLRGRRRALVHPDGRIEVDPG